MLYNLLYYIVLYYAISVLYYTIYYIMYYIMYYVFKGKDTSYYTNVNLISSHNMLEKKFKEFNVSFFI